MMHPAALAAAVALVVGAAGAWQVQAWRWAAADGARQAAEAEARRMSEARASQAAGTYEAGRAERQIEYRTLVQEVERVVDRPVYRDRQCLDADGLRLVNAAGAQTAASQPGASLPQPAAPD